MFYEFAERYQNSLLPFHPAPSIDDRKACNFIPVLKKRHDSKSFTNILFLCSLFQKFKSSIKFITSNRKSFYILTDS